MMFLESRRRGSSVLAITVTFALLNAADDTSWQSRVARLRSEAAEASKGKQYALAEDKLNAALREAETSAATQFHIKADLLGDLGNLYASQRKLDKAESAYKLQVDTLSTNQLSKRPEIDIGFALFHLQSLYDGTGRPGQAAGYVERARTFYQNCEKGFPSLRAVCVRGAASTCYSIPTA
jgi:tetratricopeptide (TPR) repeat protein